jgi:membrane protein
VTVVERFFPPHNTMPGRDPFAAVERLIAQLTEVARQVSLLAVPTFLWFSTRLFAGVRTALNEIYDVYVRPVRRHFVTAYLTGKLRDLSMVGLTLLLFLANTFFSTGLLWLERRRAAVTGSVSGVTTGQLLGQGLACVFLVLLFFAVYHFASVRRPPWRATMVGSLVAALLFEVAKRLFGLYLRNVVSYRQLAVDVNVGAVVLFVIWMYYSALVFLLGAVIAETWELRELQTRQRG